MGRIFISAVILVIAVGAFLVFQATSGTSSLVLLPSELMAETRTERIPRVRVGGRVAEPISYVLEPQLELKFLVTDPKGSEVKVPVIYHGVKPDMFEAGRDVIIDGDFEQGTIQAAKVLTQCPSKYEPPQGPK